MQSISPETIFRGSYAWPESIPQITKLTKSPLILGRGVQTNNLRNKIFAEAYGRDPDFFAFYRAMQAYETALIGGETSLILSPDSEFFKFFGSIKKPKSE